MSKLRLRPALRHWAHGLHVRGGGGPALDPDAAAYIAAMTTQPDATRKTLISDTIVALKDAGIWDELDEMWFLAAHAEQAALLGWKRYKDCVAVNAPTFTTDEGFAGDGSTSYLNTGFVPSTDGVNYTQDDASLGIYSRTNSAETVVDIGGRKGANDRQSMLFGRMADDQASVRINANGRQDVSNTDSRGLLVGRRTASNAQQFFRNGSQVATSSLASTPPMEYALYIGAVNSGGTAGLLSARQYAFAFVGAAMTEGQQEDLYEIVQDYMTAIGANV